LGFIGTMMDASANPDQSGSFTLVVTSADPPLGTPHPLLTVAGREQRLRELRALRDQGLISEHVYLEEQRRALSQPATPPGLSLQSSDRTIRLE
jgi:hypothetical protein